MVDPVASLYDERLIVSLFPGYQPVRREGTPPRGHDEDETETKTSNEAVLAATPNQGVHGTHNPRVIHSSVARNLNALGRLGFDAELIDPVLREDYQQISRDLAQTPGTEDRTSSPSHGTVGHPENMLAYGELTRLAARHEGNLGRATDMDEQGAVESQHGLQLVPAPARAQGNTPHGQTNPTGFEQRLRQAAMPPARPNRTEASQGSHGRHHSTQSISESMTSTEDLTDSFPFSRPASSPLTPSQTSFSTGTGTAYTPQSATSFSSQASSPLQPNQPNQPNQLSLNRLILTCPHGDCEGKDFDWTLPSHRNKHIKNCHTPYHELPFVCATCSNRYLWRKDLTRHLVVHTQARPFVCDECGQTFSRLDNMRRHACS